MRYRFGLPQKTEKKLPQPCLLTAGFPNRAAGAVRFTCSGVREYPFRTYLPSPEPFETLHQNGEGLVTIEAKALPRHGLMKEVRAAANSFRLEAMVK